MVIVSPELDTLTSLQRRCRALRIGAEFDLSRAQCFELEDGRALYFWGFRQDCDAAGFGLAPKWRIPHYNPKELSQARFLFLFTPKGSGFEVEILQPLELRNKKLILKPSGERDYFSDSVL